ncbi:MAG: glycerate kinase, partial [Terriglobia bacterium]
MVAVQAVQSEARTRPLKELAREIFLEALEEAEVGRLFEKKFDRRPSTALGTRGSVLQFGAPSAVLPSASLGPGGTRESVDLDAFKNIWVFSVGKAAWTTFQALCDVLGEKYRPKRGVIVSNLPPQPAAPGFATFQASHPYPDERSLAAAEALLEGARAADERTLVFFLISGGGSALVEKPLEKSVRLEDLTELNRVLVRCGASIDEINAIRKHLSAIKGGRLAAAAAKAHQVTLLLSDVPEGNLAATASGPTVPDPTTVETCYRVAEQYDLLPRFPASIRALFEQKKLQETLKPGAEAFRRSQVFLVASNRDVLHAAHRAAGARGFVVECDNTSDEWEFRRAAECLLERLEQVRRENPGQPVCLLAGGEVLVKVTGDGVGGRNQALVLECIEKISGREVAVLSAGTDGLDGNSPAAGAVADGETLARARALGLDPQESMRRSDSYHFFEALGDTL